MAPHNPDNESHEIAMHLSEDRQTLSLETPQIFGVALLILALGLAALGVGIYDLAQPDPTGIGPYNILSPVTRDGQAAWAFALFFMALGLSDLQRGARVDTRLDLVAQTVRVRNSYFGRRNRTIVMPLSSIVDTRLVGRRMHGSPCAQLRADHPQGSLALTGLADTTVADSAQKAVRSFLELDQATFLTADQNQPEP